MIFKKVINIGTTEENSFSQNKHIKTINTISLYGSIACLLYILATLPLQIPLYTLISITCILLLLLNFGLNKYGKYQIAKNILLFIMPVIIICFSLFMGPIGNEHYLLAELVFLFFLFEKTLSRIFVFTYLTSAFIFIQFGIAKGFIKLASPDLEILYYPNVITAFILCFLGLDLFYNEHIRYQKLIENQNNELKKNNAEIEARKDDLEKINIVKNKLFSVLSHDLRGPLKSILTLLDMFDNEYITVEQFKNQLPGLNEKISNTFNLTENLLDWTRSQLRGITPKKEKMDLTESVHNVIQIFDESITAKKLRLSIDFPKRSTIISDQEMVKTILRNLIHNAIKFSYEKGKINIDIEVHHKEILLVIRDEGKGMDSDIVEAFNNNKEIVSSLGTSGEKGSGLGLSITRDFVEILGGKISVKSAPNCGCCFTISFHIDKS